MTYPNEPESPRRDPNTGEPIVRPDAPYQEGYVEGQKVDDGRLFVEEQRVRDNDNAARGMLIGIIVASLLGLGVLAWYFLNQREAPVQQIIVPQRTSPAPQASPSTPPDVNIVVPSGQPQAPAPAPDVDNNITLPSAQPSQAPEPAPEINNNITIPTPAESPASQTEAPAAETPTSPSDTPDASSPAPTPGSQ